MGKFTTNVISTFLFFGLSSYVQADVNEQVRGWFYEIQDDAKTQTKEGLNAAERQALFTYVVKHKVAAITPENEAKYDPTQQIGYCYGRAMAVHTRARRMGLKPGSIQKLFIVGDLRQGPEPEWRFHVTTLVKGSEDGLWYAIDPVLLQDSGFKGTPLAMGDWVKTVRGVWDKEGLSVLYRVGAESVVPDIRVFPYPQNEDGTRITDIENKFIAKGKPGFTESKEGGFAHFELNAAAQEKYFLMAKESVDTEQFNFALLDIRQLKDDEVIDLHYDYNGYFLDLLEDIRKANAKLSRRERRLGTKIQSNKPQGTEIHKNLHSPKFFQAKP